jgi:hypothetical protein
LTQALLALLLLGLGAEVPTLAPVDQGTQLSIEACVAVDQATVRKVMELEISDAELLPASVEVRCLDSSLEIRIRRQSTPSQEDVRTSHMAPGSTDATPAEIQARSRELALSIAEFVRWPGDHPQPDEVTAPAPPAPPVEIVVAPQPAPRPDEPRWQLGALYSLERFSQGHTLTGPDLSFAAHLGRWTLVELRLGGRWGSDRLSSGQELSTRALAVSAGAGVDLWSKNRVVGGALVLRAQGYLAWVRGDASMDSHFSTGQLGVLAFFAEPRFMVALTHHLFLQTSAAVGWVSQGIAVRIQEVEAQKISGIALGANVAGVITF